MTLLQRHDPKDVRGFQNLRPGNGHGLRPFKGIRRRPGASSQGTHSLAEPQRRNSPGLHGAGRGTHRVLERAGWDVERDGLAGSPPITVLTGEEAHVTINAGLRLLGEQCLDVQAAADVNESHLQAISLNKASLPRRLQNGKIGDRFARVTDEDFFGRSAALPVNRRRERGR